MVNLYKRHECLKNIFLVLMMFSFPALIFSQNYDVPEILYYKFNNGSTTTPNYAIPGQGTNPAALLNQQLGPGGQFDSALVGVGGTSTSTHVSTGWNMNFGTSSWTISLWMNNIGTVTNYLFGNDITTSFRCFTNGAAQPGNITLRGNGIANVDVIGVLPGPSVVHFVYDNTVPEIRVYVNGTFQSAVGQSALNLNAAVPFKVGGYGTASAIGVGWLLDEFRVYSRALDAAEISATWNQTLPVKGPKVSDPTLVCDYGLIPLYPGGALGGHASTVLGDTLYIAGGSVLTGVQTNPSASTTVTRYAINTGEWSMGRNLPSAKVGGDLVKCGESLYYLGGGSVTLTAAADNFAYKYDPVAGWTPIANIPTAVTGNVAESWGDSVIFCMMGGWTQYYRGIQIYRPATNTWSRATDSIPAGNGRRTFAGGIQGNKLFVGAGYSGAFRKDFWIGTIGANAEAISWEQGPDVPVRGTGNSRPGGHAVNNRFYVVAGESTPAPIAQDSIYIWSIPDSMWLPQVITGRGSQSASNYWGIVSSSIINGKVKIWIPGGFYPTSVNTTKLIVLSDSLGCIMTNYNDPAANIPVEYRLHQNYPNPFNPTTKISFSIPNKVFVKLVVYDVLGRTVGVLINNEFQAGTHNYEFDASGLSSGIYFYSLNAGGFTNTKKMMLIR